MQIQVIGRFVQQNQISIRDHQSGQGDPFTLTSRQGTQILFEVWNFQFSQKAIEFSLVFPQALFLHDLMQSIHALHLLVAEMFPIGQIIVIPQPPALGSVVMQDGIHNGALYTQQGILFQVRYPYLFVDTDLPLVRAVHAGNHTKEGCFAASVSAQQP